LLVLLFFLLTYLLTAAGILTLPVLPGPLSIPEYDISTFYIYCCAIFILIEWPSSWYVQYLSEIFTVD